jgi:two-component sensor histidine kinase
MIPDRPDDQCLDFTIHSTLEESVNVSEEIQRFCKEQGINEKKAILIAVAAEEMAVNIVKYGGQSSRWIDVCLRIDKNTETQLFSNSPAATESNHAQAAHALILRLRDNGISFDPTTYEYDTSGNNYDVSGIYVVRKLARDITYLRAIDMNNTTITI